MAPIDDQHCHGDMILLWGLPGDGPLAAVRAALQRLGAPVALIDAREVLDTAVEISIGPAVEGLVRTPNQVVDLEAVTAAYLRPYDWQRLPGVAQSGWGSPAWCHALAVTDALFLWADLADTLVVNRPSAMAANHSKPYQMLQIRSLGFEVPDTLITTSPVAAQEFWERHSTVIYKSTSGIRSIVSRLTPEHRERINNVVWCPTQFQEYIPGRDYRVHVIGQEMIASEVISAADDYRYAPWQGAGVHIRPYDLPEDCTNRCRRLVAAMKLSVAGVDLRRTPDGSWYCFEVNPSPGFTYYQQATNQEIAEAIARLLAVGANVESAFPP